eukprot:g4679.t1
MLLPSSTVECENYKSSHKIKIGILGTSSIAKYAMINPASRLCDVEIVAVASRELNRASLYAAKHNIPKAYSYTELLADDSIDAVYIGIPTLHHFQWSLKALRAKKSVLIEKPFTISHSHGEMLAQVARENKVLLFEGFHYKFHPSIKLLKKLVQEKIGEISKVVIHASLPSPSNVLSSWMNKNKIVTTTPHEHRKMLDRYCYCINIVSYLFEDKMKVKNTTLRSGFAEFTLEGRNTTTYITATKESLIPDWSIKVFGEDGKIEFANFLFPNLFHKLQIVKENESVVVKTDYGEDGKSTFEFQLEEFVKQWSKQVKDGEMDLVHADVPTTKYYESIFLQAGVPLEEVLHNQ